MTTFDRFLAFVFSHQVAIIEIIVALTLAIIVVWLFGNLRDENSDSTKKNAADIDEIEAVMRRVLETTSQSSLTPAQAVNLIKDEDSQKKPVAPSQTAAAPTPSPAAPAAGKIVLQPLAGSAASLVTGTAAASAPQASADVTKLQAEVDARNKKVEELEKLVSQANSDLQKAKEAAKSSGSSDEAAAQTAKVAELTKKVQELEARLAEYAIIEDDIANLNLYKEENVRLKNEMEKLKTPSNAQQAPNPVEQKADGSKLAAEFENLVNAVPPVPAASTAEENKDSSAKLVEEFENFMKGTGG